jgi:hypothetical protein
MVRGSCLCGQVSYQVEAFEGGAAYCHCSMCRKMRRWFSVTGTRRLLILHLAPWMTIQASDQRAISSWAARRSGMRSQTGCHSAKVGHVRADAMTLYQFRLPEIFESGEESQRGWYCLFYSTSSGQVPSRANPASCLTGGITAESTLSTPPADLVCHVGRSHTHRQHMPPLAGCRRVATKRVISKALDGPG